MQDFKNSSLTLLSRNKVTLSINISALFQIPCFIFYLNIIFTSNLFILTFPINQRQSRKFCSLPFLYFSRKRNLNYALHFLWNHIGPSRNCTPHWGHSFTSALHFLLIFYLLFRSYCRITSDPSEFNEMEMVNIYLKPNRR